MLQLQTALTHACARPGLNPTHYQPHSLHGSDAIWPEKNCYIDLWIELIHAMGGNPLPLLDHCLALDFEGDQWTFFKPSHDELRDYYGLEVQELTIWRPLIEHAIEHLAAGKILCIETDSYWLPDTAGTDYRQKHGKTTIAMVEVDCEAERLVYFHNASCFALEGEDFRQTFGLGRTKSPGDLPLFAEIVKSNRWQVRSEGQLRKLALQRWPRWLGLRPTTNPIRQFRQRQAADLPYLQSKGLDYYHLWAFSATRQMGAGFELAAQGLNWLAPVEMAPNYSVAVQNFLQIAQTAKTLILKGARAVSSQRPVDLDSLFISMEQAWEQAFQALETA